MLERKLLHQRPVLERQLLHRRPVLERQLLHRRLVLERQLLHQNPAPLAAQAANSCSSKGSRLLSLETVRTRTSVALAVSSRAESASTVWIHSTVLAQPAVG